MERKSVAYVLKRYPRYSETFIVNEILAHEAAGLNIEIFSLLPPNDTHFQSTLASVKAPVHYLPTDGLKTSDFWEALVQSETVLPGLWEKLDGAVGEDSRHIFQALFLAREVRLRDLPHIHSHFATAATAVARMAARFANVSYSFTAHAKDIYHKDVNPEDMKRKLQNAETVITVSQYNVEFLRQKYGTAAGRVQLIYNGIDLNNFNYRSPANRPPHIIAVARLVEKKGFSDLIAACAILEDRVKDFQCFLIGAGELEISLRTQIERLGLEKKVQLLGLLPQSEVVAKIQNAAVLAAPCVVGSDGNRDGLPTVLLEAMALGTPCVSTDVTGIPEVIQNRFTGLMVPQKNPPALAAALENLLINPELRVELSRNARKLVEKNFDIHRNSAAIRNVFEGSAGRTKTVPEIIYS